MKYVTVPDPDGEKQPLVSVAMTLYVPAMVVWNVLTLPGFGKGLGTVQA